MQAKQRANHPRQSHKGLGYQTTDAQTCDKQTLVIALNMLRPCQRADICVCALEQQRTGEGDWCRRWWVGDCGATMFFWGARRNTHDDRVTLDQSMWPHTSATQASCASCRRHPVNHHHLEKRTLNIETCTRLTNFSMNGIEIIYNDSQKWGRC